MMNTGQRESVCRNLFGPVNHHQLRQDLQLKLKEIIEQDRRRWNFNFQSETPQLGRFQWEGIPASCAASFYHELVQPVVVVNSPKAELECRVCENNEHLSTDQENCFSVSNRLKNPTEKTDVRRKRSHSKVKSKNASITDYFTKRRRSIQPKGINSTFHTNFNKETHCRKIR